MSSALSRSAASSVSPAGDCGRQALAIGCQRKAHPQDMTMASTAPPQTAKDLGNMLVASTHVHDCLKEENEAYKFSEGFFQKRPIMAQDLDGRSSLARLPDSQNQVNVAWRCCLWLTRTNLSKLGPYRRLLIKNCRTVRQLPIKWDRTRLAGVLLWKSVGRISCRCCNCCRAV